MTKNIIMKTKHLDNEIERLNLMERTKDLSEYGQDMLNEFRAIKQALTIPVVIVPFVCRDCEKPTKEYRDSLCEPCHKWHTDS
jgi:hypothetical protein